MATWTKNNITKRKIFTDGNIRYPIPHSFLSNGVFSFKPPCYSFAVKDPKWREVRIWNLMLCLQIKHGLLFLLGLLAMLLAVNGFLESSVMLTVQLRDTKLALSRKVYINNLELILARLSVLLLNPLWYVLFSPLLCLLVGLCSKLMFKMPFSMAIYLRMYICPNH